MIAYYFFASNRMPIELLLCHSLSLSVRYSAFAGFVCAMREGKDLIEDLIKVDAVESVDEESIDLTAAQKTALDKELEIIKNDPAYLLKCEEIKHRYRKA